MVSVANPALSPNGVIAVGRITINEELLNKSQAELIQVVVTNGNGEHEEAIITTQLDKEKMDSLVDKVVTFTFGQRGGLHTFFGYVSRINPSRNYQTDTVADIVCLGTTWVLRTGRPRFFTNQQVPQVGAAIVSSGNLGYLANGGGYAWPSLAQSDDSDWAFLSDLAVRAGRMLVQRRGVVMLLDPLRILREEGPYLQLLKGDDILDTTRQLLDFQPTSTSANLRENVRPTFGYFQGGVASLTHPVGAPFVFNADFPVESKEMADAYDESWYRKVSFWNQSASARIQGNATITAGVMVSIHLTGTTQIRNDYDGMWLVTRVTHSITHNSFQTQLDLARDDKDQTQRRANVSSVFPGFFHGAKPGDPNVLLSVVDTGNKRWVSSWKTPQYISDALPIKIT